MSLKAIIHKASIQLSQLDTNVYADHQLTVAKHPSETDERMMLRLLAYALHAPTDTDLGNLEFTKDMFEPDEPCLWQKDYTGYLQQWIDLGQPDEKRIMRAAGRAKRVSIYTYSAASSPWWASTADKVARAKNLSVWRVQPEHSAALALLADRSMSLNITVQDGILYVEAGSRSVELVLEPLMQASA
jgi:uncharacterized protein YaeQ